MVLHQHVNDIASTQHRWILFLEQTIIKYFYSTSTCHQINMIIRSKTEYKNDIQDLNLNQERT